MDATNKSCFFLDLNKQKHISAAFLKSSKILEALFIHDKKEKNVNRTSLIDFFP